MILKKVRFHFKITPILRLSFRSSITLSRRKIEEREREKNQEKKNATTASEK